MLTASIRYSDGKFFAVENNGHSAYRRGAFHGRIEAAIKANPGVSISADACEAARAS